MSREPTSSAEAPALGFAFNGRIPPRKLPAAYQAGLLLSAFTIILLPLVYVGLIAAAAYGVYLYAIHGTVVFTGGSGGGIWRLIAYCGPLFAGVVLVGFLIKPLFAQDAKRSEPLALDIEKQPRLHAFITSICKHVGAPVPVRIDLDSQVNASARFRRGLLSLGQKDLVLTIGLPLAAGLTARQFAGVLAHEFGHFAQGAGMAATYVIRSVNNWFARVVFGRDSWDANLEEWTRGADFRIAIFLWLARGAVWISRKILHGLMYVAHAITCFQLRQMEFDADYYEIRLAGSPAFASTFAEMRRLNFAGQSAFNELGGLWRERRLVDDFSGFVMLRRAQLSADILKKLDDSGSEAKTRWSDTHPSDSDRIARSTRLNVPGIYEGDGPASALFHGFTEISRDVTRYFYRDQLELSFDDDALISINSAAKSSDDSQTANDAAQRLTHGILNLDRANTWPPLLLESFPPGQTIESITAKLTEIRSALASKVEAARVADKAYNDATDSLQNAIVAQTLLGAGIKVNPGAFGMIQGDYSEASANRDRLTKARDAKAAALAGFETLIWSYLECVCRSVKTPDLIPNLPADWVLRVASCADALQGLRPWCLAFPESVIDQRLLSVFAANREALAGNASFHTAVNALLTRMSQNARKAAELIGETTYPFTQNGSPMPLKQRLAQSLEGVHANGHLEVVLQLTVDCFFRLLGEITLAGEQLEKMGLTTPQPAEATSSLTT